MNHPFRRRRKEASSLGLIHYAPCVVCSNQPSLMTDDFVYLHAGAEVLLSGGRFSFFNFVSQID